MKKLSLLLLTLTVCFFTACHKDIWAELENLDQRVTKLEELCKEMNTNITSLQTIVSVLQSNDFITGIVEIKKNGEVIGSTITFRKHEPITIYNGEDGSATAPIIGIALDTDGVYYWTLNGEWLLDDNGNKLPVSGKDGQNGSNGTMPQLKIEEGYWYVSYDNGATWSELGKAIGEDGEKGDKGDSMFQSVTQDENYVYFTLADGTVIKIAKGNGNSQSNDDFIFTITYDPNGGEGVMKVDTFYYGQAKNLSTCAFVRKGFDFTKWNTRADGTGAIYEDEAILTIDRNITLYAQWFEEVYYSFSIAYDKQIIFSKGNLQYHPANDEWRFAPNQWDYIGEDNKNINNSYDGWIDLFGWGTGNSPTDYSSTDSQYTYSFTDWGINEIEGDSANTWRTLNATEYLYIIQNRKNAYSLRGIAEVNGVNGLILLPDNWICPAGLTFKSGYLSESGPFSSHQSFTVEEWRIFESLGAIFLPAGGYRTSKTIHLISQYGCYWLNEKVSSTSCKHARFTSKSIGMENISPSYGLNVRLVKDL